MLQNGRLIWLVNTIMPVVGTLIANVINIMMNYVWQTILTQKV